MVVMVDHYGNFNHQLVGGIPTPLKNTKVSWDDYSQYMEKMFQTTNEGTCLNEQVQ